MATDEQKTILRTLLNGMSGADKAALAPLTARDLAETVNDLVGDQKRAKVKAGLNVITRGTVSNWTGMQSASDAADATTISSDIDDFDDAMAAQNGDALFAAACALSFSAKKGFGR